MNPFQLFDCTLSNTHKAFEGSILNCLFLWVFESANNALIKFQYLFIHHGLIR